MCHGLFKSCSWEIIQHHWIQMAKVFAICRCDVLCAWLERPGSATTNSEQHQHQQNLNFTTVSGDWHARSYERVHPAPAESQFYHSFGRSTRTILRKGRTQHRKIAILLQFRAIDTHDLTKGFIGQVKNRQITTVSGDRHARSYERVHPAGKKSSNYHSFGRSTRTILRKGSSSR